MKDGDTIKITDIGTMKSAYCSHATGPIQRERDSDSQVSFMLQPDGTDWPFSQSMAW